MARKRRRRKASSGSAPRRRRRRSGRGVGLAGSGRGFLSKLLPARPVETMAIAAVGGIVVGKITAEVSKRGPDFMRDPKYGDALSLLVGTGAAFVAARSVMPKAAPIVGVIGLGFTGLTIAAKLSANANAGAASNTVNAASRGTLADWTRGDGSDDDYSDDDVVRTGGIGDMNTAAL